MSKIAHIVLWLSIFLMGACAVPQEKLYPEVANFIQLLVRTKEPTLADYAKFSGECGGDPELTFALSQCQSKGWEINSKACVDFSRQRCQIAEQVPSLKLNWLREQFSTVGKSYQLISIQSEYEGIDLIEVAIGENKFLLFHNATPYPPGGLVVGVSMVNGKKITEYFNRENN